SRRTDSDIAKAALDALKWNVQVPADLVKVNVENGRIELSGEVPWEFQKIAAYETVSNLTGVEWVDNAITIKSRINPANVKEKIEQALKRAAEREASRITIDARGNKVILTGKVRSLAELRDAQGAAWSAPGVNEVESHLKVA
ncbi:MAG: BON domain-containing protein, partial [Bdellovibrionota bacterium]